MRVGRLVTHLPLEHPYYSTGFAVCQIFFSTFQTFFRSLGLASEVFGLRLSYHEVLLRVSEHDPLFSSPLEHIHYSTFYA